MSAKILVTVSLFLASPLLVAEIEIDIPTMPLPRRATVEQLPLAVIVRGISQDMVELLADEEDLWQRLQISLPTSDAPNLLLAPQGQHPEAKYYYHKGEQTSEEADDGSFTLSYSLMIEARRVADFAELIQGTPARIVVEVSYHQWQGDRYGDPLAVSRQIFSRIDAVPAVAPEGITVNAHHHRLHIEWQGRETVAYSDGEQRAVGGVLVIVSEQRDEIVSLTDVAQQFRQAVDGGDRPLPTESECQLLPDCQFDCVDNVYLDGDKLATLSSLTSSKVVQGNSAVIHQLEAGTTYNIILQYYPDGIARSSCYQGVPIENFTLLELNNEKKAQRDDCFIATATYGTTSLLEPLYWFRDQLLARYSWGQQLIAQYYQHSPAVAQIIADNSYLRLVAKLLLFVPLLMIFSLQHPLLLVLPVGIGIWRLRVKNARRNLQSK